MGRRTLTRLALLPLLALTTTCGQAILNAPEGATIDLSANPDAIAANGGVTIISAFVFEEIGTPVADGTVVQFFTNLGQIEEQGRTNDGVARVKLVSDSRSGEATVTALSGAATVNQTVTVHIGNDRVAGILLRAQPSRIPAGSNSTHVVATVLGESGNPVPNVAVYFSVVDNPATEFFDSSGRPIFTNNNGEAEDVLRTRRDFAGEAVVRATVIGPSGQVLSPNLSIPIL